MKNTRSSTSIIGPPGVNGTNRGPAGPLGPPGYNGTQGPSGPGASSCVFKTLSSRGMVASSFTREQISAIEPNVSWGEDCKSCLILKKKKKKNLLSKITLAHVNTYDKIYRSRELSKVVKLHLNSANIVFIFSHRLHWFWESKLISSLLSSNLHPIKKRNVKKKKHLTIFNFVTSLRTLARTCWTSSFCR